MLPELLNILVCPSCLPEEHPLRWSSGEVRNGDLWRGSLVCPACATRHPVIDGVAEVLPRSVSPAPEAQAKYESDLALGSYLWSHFADLAGE